MPSPCLKYKRKIAEFYGAISSTYNATCDKSRESELSRIQSESEAHFITSSNEKSSICGQATVGLEFMKQVKDLDAVLVPCGSGGLLA